MNRKEIYKCEICGKVIEILNPGAPETICCGQPMKLMEPKTADWKGEKHVPHISLDGNKVTVDVGVEMGLDPHVEDIANFFVQHAFGQTERRDLRSHEAAACLLGVE